MPPGLHGTPPVQAVQLPPLHTRLVPHAVPSASLVPVSVHTGAPLAHESVPVWQGFCGVQVDPAKQATQSPPLHTMLVPQVVPLGAFPVVVQTDVPVAQIVWPTLHTAGVQARPEAHATHAPELQT